MAGSEPIKKAELEEIYGALDALVDDLGSEMTAFRKIRDMLLDVDAAREGGVAAFSLEGVTFYVSLSPGAEPFEISNAALQQLEAAPEIAQDLMGMQGAQVAATWGKIKELVDRAVSICEGAAARAQE